MRLPERGGGVVHRALRGLALAGGLLAVGAFATSCATTATAEVGGPDLVYVSPGVQVIADWNEPIFYSDGYYWRNAGDAWYRSSYYGGGWVYSRPPGVILSINNPHMYRHYRPKGWAPRGRTASTVRGAPAPWQGPPPSRAAFAPGSRGAPPPMNGPTTRGAPAQPSPGPHGPPPSGSRAHGPMMGHGPGHGGPHR